MTSGDEMRSNINGFYYNFLRFSFVLRRSVPREVFWKYNIKLLQLI